MAWPLEEDIIVLEGYIAGMRVCLRRIIHTETQSKKEIGNMDTHAGMKKSSRGKLEESAQIMDIQAVQYWKNLESEN